MLRIAIKHRDLYLGKVCTIEWKRSLSVLKPFKIGYMRVPSNIKFFSAMCVVNLYLIKQILRTVIGLIIRTIHMSIVMSKVIMF